VKQASLAFLFASLSVPALAGGTMTMDGLGKVHLGMTLKAAGRALGARLVVSPDYDDPSECSYANRADGRDANVAYMLHRDRIVRIDVDSRTAGKSFVDVRTEAGIGIGSSEADIRRAYGRRSSRIRMVIGTITTTASMTMAEIMASSSRLGTARCPNSASVGTTRSNTSKDVVSSPMPGQEPEQEHDRQRDAQQYQQT